MPSRLSLKSVTCAAAIAIATAIALPARAAVISGTFTGIITVGSFLSAPQGVVGDAVTGSFSVTSTVGAVSGTFSSTSNGYDLLPGSVTYSFTIPAINQTFSFGGAGDALSIPGIFLSDYGTTQSISFISAVNNPHINTYIVLDGPEGSLFTSVNDVSSVHTGPGATLQSTQGFGDFLNGTAGLNVTQSTLTSQPVPEPAAYALMAAPLLISAAIRRTRRGAP